MKVVEELSLNIKKDDTNRFYITVEGYFFRVCLGYNEFAECMGSLIKSRFKENWEGVA